MSLIVAASMILIAGALLAFAVPGNDLRAWVSLVSQAVATVLIEIVAIPIVLGAPAIEWRVTWSYPVDEIPIRIDALGAFFLAFSLPMTLLGSIYALGYMRPWFAKERHVGVHYALLNFTSLAFVM